MSVDFVSTRSDQQSAADARKLFAATFDTEPEGVWAAPGRVNLIGEHVDYAGGICLPFALTQVTVAAMSRREDRVISIASVMPGGTEANTFEIDLSEVGPQSPANWAGYAAGSVWAAVEAGLMPATGFNIALVSDVPLGAGLSSSAALECSVALGAVELATGKAPDADIREKLIACCIRAENEVVGASTGGLDQTISLLGTRGHALEIDYADNSTTQVPADFAGNDLAILVINTNAPHSLADGQYASRRGIIDQVTAALGGKSLRDVAQPVEKAREWAVTHTPDTDDKDDFLNMVGRRVRHVVSEIERTAGAVEELKRADFKAFGVSMCASHASLRDDYEVTCPELDSAVDAAMEAGALGARMTGGGFGGSAIALIPADTVDKVAEAVAAAAADNNLATPEFLVAVPSDGARRLQ
ncbi:galactokinase [Corynebacterium mendelii]|uniref:Galactokinase n=1 Tax=Corynebacterium mendelii TaxID=2765362 RepID=A0A939DXY6_9CORY|nr:galactokinase [Corynebacterium mendelii]MBN9643284.1 galactokinase [Corynebacterium mendelii]